LRHEDLVAYVVLAQGRVQQGAPALGDVYLGGADEEGSGYRSESEKAGGQEGHSDSEGAQRHGWASDGMGGRISGRPVAGSVVTRRSAP